MRQLAVGLALVGLLPVGGARANDTLPPRTLLDRAIQVHGTAANLSKFPAATWQGLARIYRDGQSSVHAVTGARQRGEQGLLTVENEIDGRVVRLVRVINGTQGWDKLLERMRTMDPTTLAEARERLHASWLATLVPLLTEPYTLAAVPAQSIRGRPAVGVRVRHPSHRDVVLYFDQDTYLLVKKECLIQEGPAWGRDIRQETYFSHYRPVAGIPVAHRLEIEWDGKRHMDLEWIEYRLHSQLPDTLFQQP